MEITTGQFISGFIISLVWIYLASRFWHAGKYISIAKLIPKQLTEALFKTFKQKIEKMEDKNGKKES